MLLCRRNQADLRGTSFGFPELDQDRLLASAPRGRAWATPFRPFPAKTGGSRWDFFCREIFRVPAYRRLIWVSVQAFKFLVLRTSERTGDILLLLVQDPISRAHHLSAPKKIHSVASKQQDVQPFLAHPATTPPLLGTNALRCTNVGSHGSNALHCCAYTSCDACLTISGAHATNFESRTKKNPCLQQALVHLLTVYEPRSYSMTAVHSTTTHNSA